MTTKTESMEPDNDDKADVFPQNFLVYGRQPGGGNDAIPDVTYLLTPGNTETPGPGQPCRAQDGKRTKRRVPRERICWVCGDRAIAHNFGALTCETCKAFFRRNAHRTKEIPQCNFDSNCNISKNTRRFCTACRMKKCFAVGMDSSLILDEEEKKAMKARRRVKQKLREKLHNQVVSSTSVLSPQVVSSPTTPSDQPTPISSPRAAAGRHDCRGALPYFFTTTDTRDPMNTLLADSTRNDQGPSVQRHASNISAFLESRTNNPRDDQDPSVQRHASNISAFQESRTNTPTSSDARSQSQLLSSLCMSPISAAISEFYSEDSLQHASSSGPQRVAASPNLARPAATTSTPRSGFKSEQPPATASSSQSAYSSYLTAPGGTQQPCVASDHNQSTNHPNQQYSEVFGQSSTATTPGQGSLGSFSRRCSDQSSPAPNPNSASIQGSLGSFSRRCSDQSSPASNPNSASTQGSLGSFSRRCSDQSSPAPNPNSASIQGSLGSFSRRCSDQSSPAPNPNSASIQGSLGSFSRRCSDQSSPASNPNSASTQGSLGSFSRRCSDQSSPAPNPNSASIQGSLGSFSRRCSDQSSPAPNPNSASIQGSLGSFSQRCSDQSSSAPNPNSASIKGSLGSFSQRCPDQSSPASNPHSASIQGSLGSFSQRCSDQSSPASNPHSASIQGSLGSFSQRCPDQSSPAPNPNSASIQGSLGSFSQRCPDQSSPAPNPNSASIQGSLGSFSQRCPDQSSPAPNPNSASIQGSLGSFSQRCPDQSSPAPNPNSASIQGSLGSFSQRCSDQSSPAPNPNSASIQGSLGSFSQRCSDQSSPAPNPHSASIQGSGLDQPTLAQGRGFRHVEREELPWDIQMYWRLTTEERSLLTQLTSAYTDIQIVQPPPEQPENFHPVQQPLCVDNLIYILDATLRKCVNFAKTVEDFRQLREADQIACLKASALKTYTLRSAALFILERNAWHTFKGDMQVADLQARFQDHTSIQFFADYCTALKSVAKTNATLYALLHCLTLFTVRDARLEDRQKVSALKDKYLLLLKHYLESEFSYSHAGRYLVELMALLEDMHNLRHKVMGFYRQFSSFFRPLVAEFFTA